MALLKRIPLPVRPFPLGPRARFAGASLVSQSAVAALFFAVLILTARLLGPGGRGEFTAWTLATTGTSVLLGGSLAIGAGRAYLNGARETVIPSSAVRHGILVAVVLVPISASALLAGAPPIPLLPASP